MSEKTDLRLPPVGWRTVADPCTECLLIIEFESKKLIWPGTYRDCYACNNRLTAVRSEKEGPSILDRYSALASYDEAIREYKLTELMFARKNFNEHTIERWLTSRQLIKFEKSGSKGTEWDVFTKNNDPEACVLVALQEGVIGRCVLDLAAI